MITRLSSAATLANPRPRRGDGENYTLPPPPPPPDQAVRRPPSISYTATVADRPTELAPTQGVDDSHAVFDLSARLSTNYTTACVAGRRLKGTLDQRRSSVITMSVSRYSSFRHHCVIRLWRLGCRVAVYAANCLLDST